MQIRIASLPPERLTHDALVEGFFSEDPRLTPYGQRIDACLAGALRRLLARDGIEGAFREHVLVAATAPRRLPGILLVGLGSPPEVTYERLYETGYRAAQTLDALHFRRDAIHIPVDRRCGLTVAGMTEAIVTGFFDFFAKTMDWGSPLPDVVIDEGRMDEALAGLYAFRERVANVLALEIVRDDRGGKRSSRTGA